MANNEEFADKVLSALKKSQKAVDLTETTENIVEEVSQQSDPIFEVTPYGGAVSPEPDGPNTGGFKDILIIPNYGGTAATTPSQINFYWKSPTTPDLTGYDTNVRTTIFNYAQTTGTGVTIPMLVFGGYDGTTNYLPSRNWNAAGAGTTAKIFMDVFRGDLTLDYLELNVGAASTTRQGNLWYDSAGDKVRFAISTSTASGFAKTLAFTDDIPGSVNMFFNWSDSFTNTSTPDLAQDTFTLASGLGVTVFINTGTDTATFGSAVRALDNTITSAQFLIASPAVNAAGTALSFLNDVSYTPNTRNLSVSSGFISASVFSGTAFTGTTFTGSLVGTATSAQNINVATTTSGTYFPVLSNTSSTTSGIAASVDAGLSYNAATDVLITGVFSGNVTGSAVTGNFVTANTLFSGNLSGNAVTATIFTGPLSGTATSAQNLNVATTTSGTYFPILSNTSSTTSGIAASVDAGLSYNAATDVLITGVFSGNVTGNAVTGNFVTANTLFSGNLSGNAVTATWHVGSLVGTATSAQNINVATTTSGTYFPVLSNTSSTTSGIAASVDAGLSYNAATDVLTTGVFSGNVTGTAVTATIFTGPLTGTATTAQNLNVATTTSGTYFPVLSNTSSTTSGIAASVDAGLSYNAATDVLITGVFSGNVTGTAVTGNFVTANTLFSGNLSGNAVTATWHVGSLVGTATTAQNVNSVATGSTNTQFFVMLSPTQAGSGVAVSSAGTALSFQPSTNTLFTTTVQANGVTVGSASNTVNVVSGSLTLGSGTNNVIIPGNLTVQGSTITVDSTISTLVDPIFVIGSAAGGTSLFTDDGKDRGVEFRWSTGAGNASTGFFGFDRSTTRFTFIPTGTNASEVFSGTAGIIEANLTGTAVTASFFTGGSFSGAFTGALTGTATTAQNLNVATTTSGVYFPVLSNTSSTTSGIAASVDAGLSYNAATDVLITGIFSGNVTGSAVTGNFITANTLFSGNLSGNAVTATTGTFTNITGAFSGTATTAQNLNVATTTSGTYFPVLSNTSSTTSGIAASVDAGLSYNAATDVLITGIFSGNVTGNAVTGNFVTANTLFSGNLSGNAVTATIFTGPLTGTATTAQNLNVATTTSGTYFPILSNTSSTTSGIAASVDANLSFNAATDVLITGIFSGNVTGTAVTGNFVTANTLFSGNLSGNAVTASFFTGGTFSGAFTGTATTAQNLNVATTTSGTYFPVLSNTSSTTSGIAASVDAGLSYNAATDVLITGIFSGNVTGNAVTGNFVTANTLFSGNLSGNAVTATWHVGSLVGTATSAQNLNVATTTSGTYFPILSNTSSTTSGIAASVDAGLSYNAATDVLITGIFSGNVTGTAVTGNFVTANTLFSGNLSGNAVTASFFTGGTFSGAFTGSATTAQNLNVVDSGTRNTVHYMLLGSSATGSGVAVSSNTNLSYNPNTNVLTTGGLAVTSSTALSSGTYLTIRTHPTDDNSTTDFFLRGVNSDGTTSKFSVDANGNLRATTKSFDISHPTLPGKRLVYGVLEGPEHGVYHRGTVEGKGAIQVDLPEYWHKLVGEEYTIQLTPWGNYNVHIVEKSQDNFVIRLVGDPISRMWKTIKVDYIVHGSRLDAPLNIIQD